MSKSRLFLVTICILITMGCAYLNSTRTTNLKSYALNVDEQANTGVPMITAGYKTYATAAGSRNLVEEQDRWQSFEYATNDQYKEELIYNGRSNNSINISYRQYKKILSSPASSQELQFNLISSDTITFKNYKIKVLNATKEYIRFRVLSD